LTINRFEFAPAKTQFTPKKLHLVGNLRRSSDLVETVTTRRKPTSQEIQEMNTSNTPTTAIKTLLISLFTVGLFGGAAAVADQVGPSTCSKTVSFPYTLRPGCRPDRHVPPDQLRRLHRFDGSQGRRQPASTRQEAVDRPIRAGRCEVMNATMNFHSPGDSHEKHEQESI
jgi:hypothetical protein